MGRPRHTCEIRKDPYIKYVESTATTVTSTTESPANYISLPVDSTCPPKYIPPNSTIVVLEDIKSTPLETRSSECFKLTVDTEESIVVQSKNCPKNLIGTDEAPIQENKLISGGATLCLDSSFSHQILTGEADLGYEGDCSCSGIMTTTTTKNPISTSMLPIATSTNTPSPPTVPTTTPAPTTKLPTPFLLTVSTNNSNLSTLLKPWDNTWTGATIYFGNNTQNPDFAFSFEINNTQEVDFFNSLVNLNESFEFEVGFVDALGKEPDSWFNLEWNTFPIFTRDYVSPNFQRLGDTVKVRVGAESDTPIMKIGIRGAGWLTVNKYLVFRVRIFDKINNYIDSDWSNYIYLEYKNTDTIWNTDISSLMPDLNVTTSSTTTSSTTVDPTPEPPDSTTSSTTSTPSTTPQVTTTPTISLPPTVSCSDWPASTKTSLEFGFPGDGGVEVSGVTSGAVRINSDVSTINNFAAYNLVFNKSTGQEKYFAFGINGGFTVGSADKTIGTLLGNNVSFIEGETVVVKNYLPANPTINGSYTVVNADVTAYREDNLEHFFFITVCASTPTTTPTPTTSSTTSTTTPEGTTTPAPYTMSLGNGSEFASSLAAGTYKVEADPILEIVPYNGGGYKDSKLYSYHKNTIPYGSLNHNSSPIFSLIDRSQNLMAPVLASGISGTGSDHNDYLNVRHWTRSATRMAPNSLNLRYNRPLVSQVAQVCFQSARTNDLVTQESDIMNFSNVGSNLKIRLAAETANTRIEIQKDFQIGDPNDLSIVVPNSKLHVGTGSTPRLSVVNANGNNFGNYQWPTVGSPSGNYYHFDGINDTVTLQVNGCGLFNVHRMTDFANSQINATITSSDGSTRNVFFNHEYVDDVGCRWVNVFTDDIITLNANISYTVQRDEVTTSMFGEGRDMSFTAKDSNDYAAVEVWFMPASSMPLLIYDDSRKGLLHEQPDGRWGHHREDLAYEYTLVAGTGDTDNSKFSITRIGPDSFGPPFYMQEGVWYGENWLNIAHGLNSTMTDETYKNHIIDGKEGNTWYLVWNENMSGLSVGDTLSVRVRCSLRRMILSNIFSFDNVPEDTVQTTSNNTFAESIITFTITDDKTLGFPQTLKNSPDEKIKIITNARMDTPKPHSTNSATLCQDYAINNGSFIVQPPSASEDPKMNFLGHLNNMFSDYTFFQSFTEEIGGYKDEKMASGSNSHENFPLEARISNVHDNLIMIHEFSLGNNDWKMYNITNPAAFQSHLLYVDIPMHKDMINNNQLPLFAGNDTNNFADRRSSWIDYGGRPVRKFVTNVLLGGEDFIIPSKTDVQFRYYYTDTIPQDLALRIEEFINNFPDPNIIHPDDISMAFNPDRVGGTGLHNIALYRNVILPNVFRQALRGYDYMDFINGETGPLGKSSFVYSDIVQIDPSVGNSSSVAPPFKPANLFVSFD